ncbi:MULTISPECIES: hypothetical protein [Moorena]|nr:MULTISPECIES: hypothetical protein [Moorena]
MPVLPIICRATIGTVSVGICDSSSKLARCQFYSLFLEALSE